MNLQNVIQGIGSLKELPLILRNGNRSRVLLITGGESFGRIIDAAVYEKLFKGSVVHRIQGFHFSPKYEDIVSALQEAKSFKPTVIVSIGGGTVIDIAKLVNAFYTLDCDIKPYIQGKKNINSTVLPHIAVPTTAGTGSEATHFAVAYLDGKKYSVAHEAMLPNHVILDPSLTYSLPSFQTAATGMDALCQGIESYWSINSTEESRLFARKAIELSTGFLLQAYLEPNPKNREGMQLAAFYSGKAINITKTTAAHAFSYHLTSKYGIPHGQAVGLLIGWVFQENLKVSDNNCNDPRGARFVRERLNEILQFLQIDRKEELDSYFQIINKQLGLQSERFSLTKEKIKELMQVVNQERLSNNPVRIDVLLSVPGRIVTFSTKSGILGHWKRDLI